MLRIKDFSAEIKGTTEFSGNVSWKLVSDRQNVMQKSYCLQITGGGFTYDSGTVVSERSLYLPLGNLPAETEFTATLTVTDTCGESATATTQFETGISSYKGAFIAPDTVNVPNVSVLVGTVTITKSVKRVRLYASALGMYEVAINSRKAGDLFFAPYWTAYRNNLEYQVYDVKELLKNGENKIEMTLGKGWFRGHLGYQHKANIYGEESAGWLNLVLEYEDGTREVIATDESWEARPSHIVDSEIYNGERVDCTQNIGEKFPVKTIAWNFRTFVMQQNEPVRVIEEMKPISIAVAPTGETVVDFGQNLTGIVRLAVKGKRGDMVTVRHAEVLNRDGTLHMANLRSAQAIDSYVLAGGEQVLLPTFTFHGFRYAGISGAEVNMENVTALVLHSDLRRTGRLTTDDASINRLLDNIVWGQRDNFLDIPTDCPQRDERLGWTGDANVFCGTAMLQYDVRRFFKKWLCDIRAEQNQNGGVPNFIPDINRNMYNVSVWSDAFPMIMWHGYELYGDLAYLEENFAAVCRYMESMLERTDETGLIKKGFEYGDWLGLDNDERQTGNPRGATDVYLVSNAYYLQSLRTTAKAAGVLGKRAKEKKYFARYRKVLAAFRKEYITATGRMASESQTALALALRFTITEEQFAPALTERLKANVENHRFHLNTGFAGTPHLLFALSDGGRHDIATALLMQRSYPSWLYEVDNGATTIWERWDGVLPNGELHDPGMNSFNHYAYGAVAEFIYRRIAGLELLEAGYKKFRIAPRLTEGLNKVHMEYESVYGGIVSEYEVHGKSCTIKAQIPANTTAEILLPNGGVHTVGSGEYEFTVSVKTNN